LTRVEPLAEREPDRRRVDVRDFKLKHEL